MPADTPALFVPDGVLEKPAGAAIDAAGMVGCVDCGTRLAFATADVVGKGYRCPACSRRVEIEQLAGGGDASSHFSDDERSEMKATGTAMIGFGIMLVVVGVAGLVAAGDRAAGKVALFAILAGIPLLFAGWRRRNAAA